MLQVCCGSMGSLGDGCMPVRSRILTCVARWTFSLIKCRAKRFSVVYEASFPFDSCLLDFGIRTMHF